MLSPFTKKFLLRGRSIFNTNNNKKPKSIEKKGRCRQSFFSYDYLALFKFIVDKSARYVENRINRCANQFFNQSSWVEIQVAHSTANTSAHTCKFNLI